MNRALDVRERVAGHSDAIVSFLRDLVAIPSLEGDIRSVAERVERELKSLGFQEIHRAPYGDVVARLGRGDRVLLYDSHLDTVGVGDPREWRHDPFAGAVENGVMYGRGTVDEKGSTPAMVYGLALARDLGFLEGLTAYYFGSIEEWCEGLSARIFAEEERIRPDWVVIGEPTDLRVYRGQKGRAEFRVTAKGRSAHGGQPWLGDNAVYKMQGVIRAIQELDTRLKQDPFLGRGSIVVTHVDSRESSLNAVPDRCSIVLDRRLTFGETVEEALEQIRSLLPAPSDFDLEVMRYTRPSYSGLRREVDQVFPAWAVPETHPLVKAGQAASQATGLEVTTGKWDFSTNGAYWAGQAHIPSIGFGPGQVELVHTVDEHLRLDDVLRATDWYAQFPRFLQGM